MSDAIRPGALVQLAGWPAAAALPVVAVHGDTLIVLAGNVQISVHRSTVAAVHPVARHA